MKVLSGLAICLWMLAGSTPVRAEDNPAREASRHFQRGVELYTDGDFRGALVEFKKAYSLLPRASVLYDIGQTEYQLQEYAEALRVLERFLAETGPTAAHHAEVVETVEVLRGRVGRIAVATEAADCEVTIDDVSAGRTPLERPVLVSIGRRKVSLLCSSRAPVTRTVEVAGGETARAEFPLSALPFGAPAVAAEVDRKSGRQGRILSWTATAILAAATISVYSVMYVESQDLDDLKRRYPVTRDALDHQATLTNRLALAGDILAGATVAAAALSTYLSLSGHEERRVQVGMAGSGLFVRGRF